MTTIYSHKTDSYFDSSVLKYKSMGVARIVRCWHCLRVWRVLSHPSEKCTLVLSHHRTSEPGPHTVSEITGYWEDILDSSTYGQQRKRRKVINMKHNLATDYVCIKIRYLLHILYQSTCIKPVENKFLKMQIALFLVHLVCYAFAKYWTSPVSTVP